MCVPPRMLRIPKGSRQDPSGTGQDWNVPDTRGMLGAAGAATRVAALAAFSASREGWSRRRYHSRKNRARSRSIRPATSRRRRSRCISASRVRTSSSASRGSLGRPCSQAAPSRRGELIEGATLAGPQQRAGGILRVSSGVYGFPYRERRLRPTTPTASSRRQGARPGSRRSGRGIAPRRRHESVHGSPPRVRHPASGAGIGLSRRSPG